jgi:hypothetical protein
MRTYLLTYLLQLRCHSVAVVLTAVQTKQIRINIHKRNNTKTQYKQYKNTVQTVQNTVNTSAHVTYYSTYEIFQFRQQQLTHHISCRFSCVSSLQIAKYPSELQVDRIQISLEICNAHLVRNGSAENSARERRNNKYRITSNLILPLI